MVRNPRPASGTRAADESDIDLHFTEARVVESISK